ncbi:threonine dehydratase [Mangrovactinospora gilvigrisea]|uniref:threonine ammonia-lyase n=1 Tax=Mangrovactinospora gilvigrisea TaxID=1428644 RepID=A0A1J7BK48_9ACTN|nr:threonine dehydratase [Mangrovactinospora gilvigrisea]
MVTPGDIEAAARRIDGVAVRTPLMPCPWADTEDARLLLKPESLQPTGAFKIRGAYNAVARLTPGARARGIVASSSGNHAQAIAYSAALLGTKAVIVMPDTAAQVKIDATRGYGAEVVLVPKTEREEVPRELAREHGYVLVPPFDHPDVIAGQGTVGREIMADAPDADVVLVPVSGGGLISGTAVAVKAANPDAVVIGVEPELAADAADSFTRGARTAWDPELTYRTIADGLRVQQVGALTWPHIARFVDAFVTVTEDEIRDTMRVLATRARLVAEPSGAVAAAAYLHHRDRLPADARTHVAVVSGGNADPALLAAVLGA